MTVDEVKHRLRYIWHLGQGDRSEKNGEYRRFHHMKLACDLVSAIAVGECREPQECAKLVVLPVGLAFYQDKQWEGPW